ncbi:MAG: FMN adenylylate transferase [Parcubacteria group bacterium GW2011_GWA2_51_10]|nr:MAG: FMN adenylylate transferase [Parcubacteria group bacterium GW2011_GWA2_51_10]
MLSFTGIVGKGTGRGTQLGFPTANIPLRDTALTGVYAARVEIREESFFAAAFADQEQKLLEAHLLDYGGNLYGKTITIHLLKKIREREIFKNETDMRQALARDVAAVRTHMNA